MPPGLLGAYVVDRVEASPRLEAPDHPHTKFQPSPSSFQAVGTGKDTRDSTLTTPVAPFRQVLLHWSATTSTCMYLRPHRRPWTRPRRPVAKRKQATWNSKYRPRAGSLACRSSVDIHHPTPYLGMQEVPSTPHVGCNRLPFRHPTPFHEWLLLESGLSHATPWV